MKSISLSSIHKKSSTCSVYANLYVLGRIDTTVKVTYHILNILRQMHRRRSNTVIDLIGFDLIWFDWIFSSYSTWILDVWVWIVFHWKSLYCIKKSIYLVNCLFFSVSLKKRYGWICGSYKNSVQLGTTLQGWKLVGYFANSWGWIFEKVLFSKGLRCTYYTALF
jgi:hypothetical protein